MKVQTRLKSETKSKQRNPVNAMKSGERILREEMEVSLIGKRKKSYARTKNKQTFMYARTKLNPIISIKTKD